MIEGRNAALYSKKLELDPTFVGVTFKWMHSETEFSYGPIEAKNQLALERHPHHLWQLIVAKVARYSPVS